MEKLCTAKKYTLETAGMQQYSHCSYFKIIQGLHIFHAIQGVAIIINHVFTLYLLC